MNLQYRSFRYAPDASEVDADSRTIEMAISSEEPYERWFGVEILSHKSGAINLSRLARNDHPLLVQHDTDKQIGVLSNPRVERGKLRVTARFSRAAFAEEIRQDVADGIRQLVSVGYLIDEIVEVAPDADASQESADQWSPVRTFTGDEFRAHLRALAPNSGAPDPGGQGYPTRGADAARGKTDLPTYIVTKWTPFEASIVPIPADPTVGVGRAGVMPAPDDDLPPVAGEAQPASPISPAAPDIRTERNQMTIEKTPAELEIERRDALAAIGEQYSRYLGPNDIQQWIRDGWSLDRAKDAIIAKIQTMHTDTRVAVHVGLSTQDARRYSLGRAIRAQLLGDWTDAGLERACSEAVAKIIGAAPEGFYVPGEALMRDFNAGVAAEAGNLIPNEFRGDLFADVLRNNLVIGRLGCRILGGLTSNLEIPRKTTGTAVASLTEIQASSETTIATAKPTLSPKRVGAHVEASKQGIIQAAMSVEAMIRDDLLSSAAVQIENLVINGTGVAPQFTGIRATAGIGTVVGGTNGLAPAWSHFVDLESVCAAANAEPDIRAGYLINTKTRGKLKQTQLAANLPFIWQAGPFPVNGYRVEVTNNVPSNLTKGTSTSVCSSAIFSSDWLEAILGLFGAPDITVDPYTLATTGQVRITLNQYADFLVRQAACFSKIDDLLAG